MEMKDRFARLESTSWLYMVQEESDYWITEGGDVFALGRLIDLRIELHLEGAGMWKHLPEKAMDHVRYLEMFFGAKQELEKIKGEMNRG